ncbi:hypothetical protein ACFL2H_06120 [Planctomycetota bacterium]
MPDANSQPPKQFNLKRLFGWVTFAAVCASAFKYGHPLAWCVVHVGICYLAARTGIGIDGEPVRRGMIAGGLVPACVCVVAIGTLIFVGIPNTLPGVLLVPFEACLNAGLFGFGFGAMVGAMAGVLAGLVPSSNPTTDRRDADGQR